MLSSPRRLVSYLRPYGLIVTPETGEIPRHIDKWAAASHSVMGALTGDGMGQGWTSWKT
jgi:hypothetical protein